MSDAAVYPESLEQFLQAGLNLSSLTVKILLVDVDYVYDAAHNFLDDVVAGARHGTPATLTGKTFTAGVFRASPVSYTGVALAAAIRGLIGYVDTGVESTSRLVWFDDQGADKAPMSFTGTGLPIPVAWPDRCFSI